MTSLIEDATGNHGNGLSPFESAWKARVLVSRTDPEPFDASDKWTIGPIAVSPVGSKQSIDKSGSIGEVGFKVRTMETKAPRAAPIGAPQPSPASTGTKLPDASATGLPVDRIIRVDILGLLRNSTLITVVDDQAGRRLSEFNQTFLTGESTLTRGVGIRFTPKSDTTHVSLTLIVGKPSEFEFLFVPPAAP